LYFCLRSAHFHVDLLADVNTVGAMLFFQPLLMATFLSSPLLLAILSPPYAVRGPGTFLSQLCPPKRKLPAAPPRSAEKCQVIFFHYWRFPLRRIVLTLLIFSFLLSYYKPPLFSCRPGSRLRRLVPPLNSLPPPPQLPKTHTPPKCFRLPGPSLMDPP